MKAFKMLVFCLAAQAYSSQEPALEAQLVKDLADETTRNGAIHSVLERRTPSINRLMNLGRNPPPDADQHAFRIGLADLFGQLKAKEAIPFLVENIALQRYNDINTWTRTDEVVEERLPAALALIHIGDSAVDPLARAYWNGATFDERNAIMFTMSRIAAPGTDQFFRAAIFGMRRQMEWAEAGLRKASSKPTPPAR